jgi:antitoxin (DNA-binding transcriptional repressor) of toxin-antitoxin stability system
MEPEVLHITEADLVRDVRAILQRVETGAEIIIERDAQPVAVLRAASPVRRTISECIALAKAHEEQTGIAPTLEPDFAADVEEIIRNRQPWNPPPWD